MFILDNLALVCLNVVGLDGCFIKLTTGQQILAATGRDGNNNIFPIAFGVVDKEDTASWLWFLTQLKYCIGTSGKHGNYTIISDRQKVSTCLFITCVHLLWCYCIIIVHLLIVCIIIVSGFVESHITCLSSITSKVLFEAYICQLSERRV